MTEQPLNSAFNTPDIAALNALNVGQEPDLVSLMVTYYQSKRPSWSPNAGHIETMLFEAFALALSGEIVAVNNIAYQVVQQLMAYEGVYADEGARAGTRVKFTVTPSLNPVTIPAWTRLRLTLDESQGAIPEISANKYMLWVRFTSQGGDLKPKPLEDDVPFELTLCNF